MPERTEWFDAASVREAWDRAADAWVQGQSSGRDYYRYEFFGPAQVAMCGEVRGMRLLDVGCGSGYFAREMAQRGARVAGIDISPRMIQHARRGEEAAPLGIDFVVGDAAQVADRFAAASFDMATSCMALQDVPDVPATLRGVAEVLRPGGRFVASVVHPCTDTPFRQWERDEAGRKRWLCIDRYFERGPLETAWSGWAYDFTTPALHATLEDWFGWIHGAGFRVRALREPRPTEDAVRARPELEDAARVPYFLIFDLFRVAPLPHPEAESRGGAVRRIAPSPAILMERAMLPLDLGRLLASVGKGVFVRYFDQFRDFGVPNDEVAALLPQEYTLKSRRSRTSTARRIIREGLSRDALESIVSSDRLDPETLSKARLLLERPSPALTQSTIQRGRRGNPAPGPQT